MPAKVIQVMPGCTIVEFNEKLRFMAGQPAEVLKVLKRQNLVMPTIWISPTYSYQYGIVQSAMEFPVYDFLFFQGRYFKGEKLTIIGTAKQVERIRAILQLTLLGPTFEQMTAWGIDYNTQHQVRRMSDFFALKKLGTKDIASIDDMINFEIFSPLESIHPNQAEFEGVTVKFVDVNKFELSFENETVNIDINIHEPQRPPIEIPTPEQLAPRATFGATALSKLSTGFDQFAYTSGLLLWINGMGISVDGVAWMKEHLRILGVNPHEIISHIVTHIHDDHCNILDLIFNGKQFHMISDRLGYECLLLKASLLLDISIDQARQTVILKEIQLNKPFYWYGAKFEFWRAVHTIPTLGFRVTMNGKSIVVTGDTAWGQKINTMYEAGALNPEHAEFIQNIPYMESDLTFFDAGGKGGATEIHPDIFEIAKLPNQVRRVIVPTHTPMIPPELIDKFQTVSTGQSWVLVDDQQMQTNDYVQIKNAPFFTEISELWFSTVLHQGRIINLLPGHNVIKHGEPGKEFYLIIAGTMEVVDGDKVIAKLSTGDFFGEMSLIYNVPCTATVRTKSHVKLLALNKHIFMQLLENTDKYDYLRRIHQIRPIFMNWHQFRDLPTSVLNEIYRNVKQEAFDAGRVIIQEGDEADKLYGIISGTAEVWHSNGNGPELIATLNEHEIFGEMALWRKTRRSATVIAKTDMYVFSISAEAFEEIKKEVPIFSLFMGKLVSSRMDSH